MTGTRRARGLARVIADRTGAHIDHISNLLGKAEESDLRVEMDCRAPSGPRGDAASTSRHSPSSRGARRSRERAKRPWRAAWQSMQARQLLPVAITRHRRLPADSAKATQRA
jgi:hypothetical protein